MINIERFIEDRSAHMTNIIFDKYGTDPVAIDRSFLGIMLDSILFGSYSYLKVKQEIYAMALRESTAFFGQDNDIRFNKTILGFIQDKLLMRTENPKTIKGLTPEESLANVIQIRVLDLLVEKGCVL